MSKMQYTDDGVRIRDNAASLESPPASVIKILNGAMQALAQRGANRLSMSDICHVSGVSRGTLYRYFSTKEDVLSAVSEYVSRTFENGVREVAAAHDDPLEKLRAVIRFHNEYSTSQTPNELLLVEPVFLLEFFRSHFERHRSAVLDALAPVFDHFDAIRREKIEREGLVELLIRLQLSRLILPSGSNWDERWEKGAELIEAVIVNPAAHLARN